MKKILVLHSKHSPIYYDASTPELEEESYRKIFKFNDKDFNCYEDSKQPYANKYISQLEKQVKDLKEAIKKIPAILLNDARNNLRRLKNELKWMKRDADLYAKAKKGNIKAIKDLVNSRSEEDAEYERVSIEEVE